MFYLAKVTDTKEYIVNYDFAKKQKDLTTLNYHLILLESFYPFLTCFVNLYCIVLPM